MREGYMNLSTDAGSGIDDGGPEGARRATGGPPSSGREEEPLIISPPDPEVPEKKARRKFTAKYKLQILQEADACTEPGQLGAFLRRKGLYSSNLTTWHRQREEGLLNALSPKKRGRKGKEKNPLTQKVAALERENERLKRQLKKAETIIDVQKKISEILGISQEPTEDERRNS
jgi:transposase-like protein